MFSANAGNAPGRQRTCDDLAGQSVQEKCELSQTLHQQWLTADYDAKRRILAIVCLNCRLDGATFVPQIRKPFDVLAEGLLSENSRGDKTAIELFIAGVRGWEGHLRQQLEAGKVKPD